MQLVHKMAVTENFGNKGQKRSCVDAQPQNFNKPYGCKQKNVYMRVCVCLCKANK